jgi:glycerol-3-phosphate O-acyltransferase
MCDRDVLKAVADEAKARDGPIRVIHARARRYAKEIVPAFSAYAYFRVGTGLAKWPSTVIYRVRLGALEETRLYQVPQDTTVVFVINHRSNMDYALVTALLSRSSMLSYAVGEWGRVPVLQSLIHAMGSYFVRRETSNALYRKVLARYVHIAVTQAVFPEGGLTLDGKLRPPKLGLLSYMSPISTPTAAATSCWRSQTTDVSVSPVRRRCMSQLATNGRSNVANVTAGFTRGEHTWQAGLGAV